MRGFSTSRSEYGLVQKIESVQSLCEENEVFLSSENNSFLERKNTGSYYTPKDTCDFFWNEFFALKNIKNKNQAVKFIKQVEFVEPAVGAGIFVFSLIKKLILLGCPLSSLAHLRVTCLDINARALAFVRQNKTRLEVDLNGTLGEWNLEKKDYLKANLARRKRRQVFIGNPPFVKNGASSRWKNSFADFFEKSYCSRSDADIAFIMPLSFSFSRDYSLLRGIVLEDDSSVYLANFDNIPDCIFKAGKFNTLNSNTANSQRCTIGYVFQDRKREVFSTALIRWKADERHHVFSERPRYYDISKSLLSGQFIRPSSEKILSYIKNKPAYRLGDMLAGNGKYTLHVAGVARNYISFRHKHSSGGHELNVGSQKEFYSLLAIIGSDVFYEYWLTVGDGFHLTKGDIYNFPVSKDLWEWSLGQGAQAKKVWSAKSDFMKSKLNAGRKSVSYDFSSVFVFRKALKKAA